MIKKGATAYPKTMEAYSSHDLAFEVGHMVVEARIMQGVTQAQLAELVGTKQPAIARIENGNHLPSLGILEKIAQAFNTYLVPPRFGFMVEKEDLINVESQDSGFVNSTMRPTSLFVTGFSTNADYSSRPETKYAAVMYASSYINSY